MSNSRRDQLIENLRQRYASFGADIECQRGEVLLILSREHLLEGCQILKEDEALQFNQLIDVCGVDYATYGQSEWIGDAASARGFSRGTHPDASLRMSPDAVSRFAVVYHLLSTIHNHRLRLRVYLDSDQPTVPSLNPVWASANWFERETYDLFGIVFEGHPDLRRILTDYGFIGHPFRKDFPLSGHVEVRYDPDKKRVVYEPVSIEPRTLVPRVIRHDHRYIHEPESD